MMPLEGLRILVTRPVAQAAAFVESLRLVGMEALALPLIAIEPVSDPSEVRRAASRLGDFDVVIFVSPNAVLQFFGALGPQGWVWPEDLRVGALGPGTLQALVDAGLPPERITAPTTRGQMVDSEALWVEFASQNWQGRRVMIVRGDGGRDWLADQFRASGAEVSFVQAYRRTLPVWAAGQQHLAQQAVKAPQAHVWLFSSSQSIDHLLQLCPQERAVWPRCHALATHPRIADRARSAGFGRVLLSPPDQHSIVTCIQSASW